MMNASIQSNIDFFSTKRMLEEYYEKLYKLEGNELNSDTSKKAKVLV
jgi:hypothetical protein